MLVVLGGASYRTCVVVEKSFIQSFKGDQSCLEVACVQTPLLTFRLLSDDKDVVLSGRELVENESVILRQVLFDAYAGLKRLQKDITLPEPEHLYLRLLGLQLA